MQHRHQREYAEIFSRRYERLGATIRLVLKLATGFRRHQAVADRKGTRSRVPAKQSLVVEADVLCCTSCFAYDSQVVASVPWLGSTFANPKTCPDDLSGGLQHYVATALVRLEQSPRILQPSAETAKDSRPLQSTEASIQFMLVVLDRRSNAAGRSCNRHRSRLP